jgi:hypothetical protein
VLGSVGPLFGQRRGGRGLRELGIVRLFSPRGARAAPLAFEDALDLDGDVFVDGAGVGLLLGHPEFREQIDDRSGLDFEFAR